VLMELDELIILLSSFLALLLFVLSLLAYLREHRKKLFLVTLAFFFYFLMGFFDTSEVFFPMIGDQLEILGSFLNIAVLVSFYLAILTKE